MFYVGTAMVFSGFNLLTGSIDQLVRPMHHGLPFTGVLFCIAFSLILAGIRIVSSEFGKEHKASPLFKSLGIFCIIAALLNVFDIDDPIRLSDILGFLSYMVTGVLLVNYNNFKRFGLDKKPIENEKSHEVIRVQLPSTEVQEEPVIHSVIGKLLRARLTKTAQHDKLFTSNLIYSQIYLTELERQGFEVNEYIIKQIDELLDVYFELERLPIRTTQAQELLNKVVNSFSMIAQSLETMYDDHFHNKAYQIESDIQTLEMKLKAEGLIDSDFK